MEFVRRWLASFTEKDPSLRDEHGLNAVARACFEGKLETVRELVSSHPKLAGEVTADRYNVLHLAVVSRNAALVELLLSFGRPYGVESFVGARDGRGLTPLMIACNNGELEMASSMLNQAYLLDLFQCSADGRNALHFAASAGHDKIVAELLREAEARTQLDHFVNAVDKEGFNSAHSAALGGSVACLELLCAAGVKLNEQTKTGHTPLTLAARKNACEVLEVLLRHGANAHAAGSFGLTALHEAVLFGAVAFAGRLLAKDHQLAFARDDDGLTPLHCVVTALRKGSLGTNATEMAALFVDSGCVDAVDYSDATALVKACFNLDVVEMVPLVKYLVSEGKASVEKMFDHGWCALHVVSNLYPDQEDLLQFLKKHASDEFLCSFDPKKPRCIDNSNFQQKCGRWNRIPEEQREAVLQGQRTMEGIAKRILDGRSRKIVVMSGAGISTSIGIPDFRGENGIYRRNDAAKKVFDRRTFDEDPSLLYAGCKDMFLPFLEKPTLSAAHKFMQLLQKKGLLVRVYDQNVDCLTVGCVGKEKVREAHGTLRTARCAQCFAPSRDFWNAVREDRIARCDECGGVVRPDVVFFGEGLPHSFQESQFADFKDCDLLLVMGTSLTVYPFAGLCNMVGDLCPRVLFNSDLVGPFKGGGQAYRDIAALGDIDESVNKLVKLLGWEKDFLEIGEIRPLI